MISLKSKISKKILSYFSLNPDESLYLNELVTKFKVDKRNLAKKLKEFENEGLMTSEQRGNLKLYSINKDFSLYEEYRKMILKTVGIEDALLKICQKTKGLKQAFIFGSYAQNKLDSHSDIDLLLIGSHNIITLQSKISKLQRKTNREINIVHMGEAGFKKKKAVNDPFIKEFLKNKKIKLL